MLDVVMDTNVLVSALLAPESKPAKILALALNGKILLHYDSRILLEYENVLNRPKFRFDPADVSALMEVIIQIGAAVSAEPRAEAFTDEADKKFYETAKSSGALLITGNLKHFPQEPGIVSPAEFLIANLI